MDAHVETASPACKRIRSDAMTSAYIVSTTYANESNMHNDTGKPTQATYALHYTQEARSHGALVTKNIIANSYAHNNATHWTNHWSSWFPF